MAAPTLTPSSAILDGKQVQAFSANQAARWTTTGGTLYTDSGATIPYVPGTLLGSGVSIYLKAINITGAYLITATNAGSEAGNASLAITGVCPSQPSWPYDVDNEISVLMWEADDEVTWESRTLSAVLKKFPFIANSRQKAEYEEFYAFHTAHFPSKKFYFTHPDRNLKSLYRFTAIVTEKWQNANLVDFSTVMKETA